MTPTNFVSGTMLGTINITIGNNLCSHEIYNLDWVNNRKVERQNNHIL